MQSYSCHTLITFTNPDRVSKTPHYQTDRGSRDVPCGHTDMTKPKVTLHNSANAPNKRRLQAAQLE